MSGEVWQLVDSGGVGGIETHVRVLAKALAEAGWPCRVLLLADHGANPWLGQLKAAGVPFEVLDGRFSTVLARLKRDRPALLHTHGYKAGILGRLAARLAGIPSVSTFHAGERGPFPVSLYQRLDEATSRLGARIAVSTPIAKALPAPVSVIGNFVPVPDTPPTAPASDVVGFVGRFSLEKGPDLFCILAERFAGKIPFEMFGDGPMRAGLEAEHGKRVRFHGLVTDPGTIWPRIGLLLMPSRAEGLPMAAIEAMAAGVPVAASAVGALPDLIRTGENGWLFPPLDLDAATQAVAAWQAGGAAQRAGWSQAAWRTAREGFGTQARLPQIIGVYEQALGGRHG
ncbi:glycosyltransferase family 4 protein [Aquabacter sp. CN5-332]|uniref:glycosyltransferase family 4 protein n=1 Tax=Aquabacter sp. CN5-332 TaxID=3156608 RepID=UPI0032B47322